MNAIPTKPAVAATRPAATRPAATRPAATGGCDIQGAFGTIARRGQSRSGWRYRLRTLLAILGPGLIVMVGDNDAGAFATYTQAGQNHGTALMWTLLLLVPVLYANQEMVLRLGAVTGVGYARLLLARFGRFWGLFTVLGMIALNGLTVVTEFIGISLALDHLGIARVWGVLIAAVLTIIAASTGDFRRFERFAMMLVLGSLLLVPVFVAVHPPLLQVAHDLVVPQIPAGRMSDIVLLVIAIVGTTVAPWQLFFQQSYVIDKRITARFIPYEKIDLWLGIVIVIIGAVAMMGFAAATFAGKPEFGRFTDVGGVAAGLATYVGPVPGVLFAIALIDASMIGTAAVALSTAYAVGDLLAVTHSLHRTPGQSRSFTLIYAGLIAASAVLVLIPGSPLGLITVGVQTLAGVLLPSATVFLLLLCNDRAVLGPWVNGLGLNLFTSAVIALLVLLSVILTGSVLFPDLSDVAMLAILAGGLLVTLAGLGVQMVSGLRAPARPRLSRARMAAWRMPALESLPPADRGGASRVWMGVMWLYLLLACAMVVLRVVQLALGGG